MLVGKNTVGAVHKNPDEQESRENLLKRLKADGVVLCAAEASCLLSWIPLGYELNSIDWFMGFRALIPVCSFLLAAVLAGLFSTLYSEGWGFSPHAKSAVRASLAVLGCLLGLLHAFGIILTASIHLFIFGLLFAVETTSWFQKYSGISAATYAVAVTSGLLVMCLLLVALLFLSPVAMNCVVLVGNICGVVISKRKVPLAEDSLAEISRSKLLDISVSKLIVRYNVSFFTLGLITGVMLVLFSAGPGRDPQIEALYWLPMGVVVLVFLLTLSWIRNHEPDFMLTLELSLVLALVAFFPFYPGTDINQRLALVMGVIWAVTLSGLFLLVSKEIDKACEPAQKYPFIAGFSALLLGSLCGSCAIMLLIDSSWYSLLQQGPYGRTMFVTALGASSIALTYICTNILLNRDRLRSTRLLARGKFLSLVNTQQEAGDFPDSLEASIPSLEHTCRDIALEYALTPREYDVLVILARGNSMARVQEELVISEGTAITHRRNLYRKLLVTNKQELIDFVQVKQYASKGMSAVK